MTAYDVTHERRAAVPVTHLDQHHLERPVTGMHLSDELESLRKTVEEFAHDVVAPTIGDFYERDEFPYEIVRQMGEMGLFGLPFPEEHGGMGGDYFALCVALEELARVDSSVAITLEAGGLARRDADLPVRDARAAGRVAAEARDR